MRSQRVFTHFRCNQNCAHCTYRRPTDDPRAIAGPVVRGKIDEAIAAGAHEIVLSGGEPTMRRDLSALVAHAREQGATRVVLETNATLIDDALAAALVSAGLTLARVHLPIADDRLDALTRDAGGFRAARAGVLALSRAQVPIEIAAPLVRTSAAVIADLPGALRALLGDDLVRIVVAVPTQSPDPAELLTWEEATAALSKLDLAGRRHGVRVQLAEESGPPPCAFPASGRPHHLYALTRGGARSPAFEQLPGCARCSVRDRCPGVSRDYLARHPSLAVTPIEDDRSRRRLSVVGSIEAQMAKELVQTSYSGRGVDERLIRVNFACNQACDFCFVSTHLPTAPFDDVQRAIVAASAEGKRVVLSGGEPALNPKLVEYVRLAKEHAAGRWPIEIQTNAVLLDDRAKVDALVAAGLDAAFVSLHGSRAEISDAVTRAPGTFARTVVGIDNLVRAGVSVILNFVICTANKDDVTRVVELVAERWPGVPLNVSFVAPSTDVVPRERWLIPRYADALPPLEEAFARARALGVAVIGLESMCGLPLCLVPDRLSEFLGKAPIVDGGDEGEFLRAEACVDCALSTRCWGLRRGYAEIHGTSELRAVRLPA